MFTYDINITTAFVGLSSAVAFYILVVRLGDRTKAAEARVAKAETELASKAAGDRVAHAETELERLSTALAAHTGAFAMYREQVARELCSRETIREVEDRVSSHIRDVEGRVMSSITNLGSRIDRMVRLNGHET